MPIDTLFPHWKYVFVILWLCFASFARVFWREEERSYALSAGIWGSIIALGVAIASGTVAIGTTVGAQAAQLFNDFVLRLTDGGALIDLIGMLPPLKDFPVIGAFPIIGIYLFLLTALYEPIMDTFSGRMPRWFFAIGAAGLSILIGELSYVGLHELQFLWLRTGHVLPAPEVFYLAIFFIIVAAGELIGGIQYELEHGRSAGLENDTAAKALTRSGDAKVGLYMFGAVAGALFFVFINAAVNFTGL